MGADKQTVIKHKGKLMPPVTTATAWLWLITSRRQPSPLFIFVFFKHFYLKVVVQHLFVPDPSRATEQSMPSHGHYCKNRTCFSQGRYDRTWHTGLSPLCSWLQLIPRLEISSDAFGWRFEFTARYHSRFNVLRGDRKHTRAHARYNAGALPDLVSRRCRVCLPAVALLSMEASPCHDADSVGWVLVSNAY